MFCESRPRVLELLAGCAGVGRTAVAVNLCAALARGGRNVLLVECADGAGRLHRPGIEPQGGVEPRPVGIPGASGFEVLELVRARWDVSPLAGSASGGAASALAREVAGRDCIVVSSMIAETVLVPEQGRRDVLLVVSQSPASITDAYALVKRMAHEAGACRFGVVVNRADSDAAALRMFDNFARVAHGYLGVRLEMLGAIPADPWIRHAAAQGRSVLDCSPRAPCAGAFLRLAEALDRRAGDMAPRPRSRSATSSAPSPLAI